MKNLAFLIFALGLGPGYVSRAEASLGGDATSVTADARAMSAVVQSLSVMGLRVEQVTSASGLTVREYLSADGLVYALAWDGPVMPDLGLLLGDHYAAFAAALKALPQGGLQRAVSIRLQDLIVESAGHLRAYRGRAVLPQGLPSGVTRQELR